MDIKKATQATRKLITGDMYLNWFLGLAFILFNNFIDGLIGFDRILPFYVWMLIGLGFIGFAYWQTSTLKRGEFRPKDYRFAAWLAWIPAALLTVMLFMDFPLHSWARIVLWIGNIYMVLLGVWYLYLAKNSKD